MIFKNVIDTTPMLRPHFFTSALFIRIFLSCKNIQSSKSTKIVLSPTFRFNLYFQFSALPWDIPLASPITSEAVPLYWLFPNILIVQILESFYPSSYKNFSSRIILSDSNVPVISTLKVLFRLPNLSWNIPQASVFPLK